MSTTYKRIGAIGRMDTILTHVANARTPVSTPELARAVDMPKETVACYLATLADHGWIKQTGDTYELGMRAAWLWAKAKAKLEMQKQDAEQGLASIGA